VLDEFLEDERYDKLCNDRRGSEPVPSAGGMKAPKPDIRLRVSAAYVVRGDTWRLVAEVQNHSPADFLFSSLQFTVAGGPPIVITHEATYNLSVMPETIPPGGTKSIVIDAVEMKIATETEAVANALVVDKMDRRYFADPKETEIAIAKVKKMVFAS
jgi:hypothetical protein